MNIQIRGLLPLLLSLPLLAQQPAPAPSASPTVHLDVTVTGRSGKPVPGLAQSNFTVLDNGLPQPILSFRAIQAPFSDPPVQIILLIDSVNTSLSSVSFERDQITQYLRKSGPTLPYPLSFIFFSDNGAQIQRVPSRDTAKLLANLKEQDIGLHSIRRSSGFYGAVERLDLSIKTISQIAEFEQKTPGRKLLIWISPGWPYLSGPRISLSDHEERGLFSTVVGLSASLERARISLYSIDPIGVADAGGFRTIYYEEFLKGVASPRDVQSGNLALQVLAEHTGSRVFHSGNDLDNEIAACVDDASAFYELTIPRAPADSGITFHAIQVKVPDTSLKPRTLFGYYAQPAAATTPEPH